MSSNVQTSRGCNQNFKARDAMRRVGSNPVDTAPRMEQFFSFKEGRKQTAETSAVISVKPLPNISGELQPVDVFHVDTISAAPTSCIREEFRLRQCDERGRYSPGKNLSQTHERMRGSLGKLRNIFTFSRLLSRGRSHISASFELCVPRNSFTFLMLAIIPLPSRRAPRSHWRLRARREFD